MLGTRKYSKWALKDAELYCSSLSVIGWALNDEILCEKLIVDLTLGNSSQSLFWLLYFVLWNGWSSCIVTYDLQLLFHLRLISQRWVGHALHDTSKLLVSSLLLNREVLHLLQDWVVWTARCERLLFHDHIYFKMLL